MNGGPDLLTVSVVMTCHNRRGKTTACLRSLLGQEVPGWKILVGRTGPADSDPGPHLRLHLHLMDDGSSDGTGDAAMQEWPDATILRGNGNLFWCGGMREAWRSAAREDPDFYWIVNDDTLLFPSALVSLLQLADFLPETRILVAGAIADPETGEWSYGGLEAGEPFPPPSGKARCCRSMNANCALVPRAVFSELGVFHHAYRHAMGDLDYGWQATRRGIPILETPQTVGLCARNAVAGTWRDTTLGRRERWRLLVSPRGLPPREWFHFCRRNAGWRWIAYFVSPYLRVLHG